MTVDRNEIRPRPRVRARWALGALCLALVFFAWSGLSGLGVGAAQAQPAQPQAQPAQPQAQPTQPVQVQRVPVQPGQVQRVPAQGAPAPRAGAAGAQAHGGATHAPEFSDRALNQGEDGEGSYGAALVFWLFALGIIGGSIFVITRRNLITAVMGMVGTFFAIAAVYAMLYAHFLTAIQVLVYAGAIMVLFVFVIMVLNRPEAEPWSELNLPGKLAIMAVLGYLLVRFVMVVWNIEIPEGAIAKPEDIQLVSGATVEFGSTKALGHALFRDYLFPFEAVSLVLLIAIVGAIAVARPHERRPALINDEANPGNPGQASSAATSK